MFEVYLDNNATTAVAPEVLEKILSFFLVSYGNPSSLHRRGVEVDVAISKARRCLSVLLRAKEQEIIFTSGGTESVNLAVKGVIEARKRFGAHIVTTPIEHDSVLATLKQLQQQKGVTVDFARVDCNGRVSLESVMEVLKADTILVSIMHVNNELGTINPVEEIAKEIKLKRKDILFFVDGAQAFGKREVNISNIDLYSISGHKFHGPKGGGVLYVKEKTPIQPLITGGGQEFGLRSGTENVIAIVGLAEAAKLAYSKLHMTQSHLRDLKFYFLEELKKIPQVVVNSTSDTLENTVNVSFDSIPSEVMMYSLEEKGIYVSAGSACRGAKRKQSHVLKAIGLPANRIQSAIRFSFSRYTTWDEICYTLESVKSIVNKLSGFKKS